MYILASDVTINTYLKPKISVSAAKFVAFKYIFFVFIETNLMINSDKYFNLSTNNIIK